MLYPALYIGRKTPPRWGKEYPIYEVRNIGELRDFVDQYYHIGKALIVGLDLRRLHTRWHHPLLKLLEDSRIQLIIRTYEPVLPTMLSRCMQIEKDDYYEIKSPIELFIRGDTITADKIRGLR